MPRDVVVIGGGIIGAMSALELAKAGSRVRLIEKNKIGQGASGNSAAMLELQLDAHRGEPFVGLAQASHNLFPELSRELLKLSGIDIHFQRCSILQVALTPAEAGFLKKECARQRAAGFTAPWLEPSEVAGQLSQLTRRQFGAALYADDGQVNGTLFLKAAIKAARALGVEVTEGATKFSIQDVLNSDAKIVVAAGAWTDQVLEPLGVHLGITPVRGQLMYFETPSAVLPYPVYTKTGGYLTPKQDGTTLAGTTIENVGYNSETTNEGQEHISELVRTLMPNLRRCPMMKMTAGLRPKSPDDLPFIGALPGHPNVIVAAGHYRNGILLAPITAKIVAALVDNKQPPVAIEPFSPSRVLAKA